MQIRNNNTSPAFGIKISNEIKNKLTACAAKENKIIIKSVAQRIKNIESWDYPNTELVIRQTECRNNDCFALMKYTERGTVGIKLKSGYYKRNLANKLLNITQEEIKSALKELDYKIAHKIFERQPSNSHVKIQKSEYSDEFKKLFRNTYLY